MSGTTAPVLYVLKRFPRLSETFVLREILALERSGQTVLVDALLEPEDEPRHPDLADLRAAVRYLPRRPRLRHPSVARVHARLLARRPVRWLRLALRARRHGTWRRFLQAGLVADRTRAEGVAHLHAHFATAAAEVARDAAALAGVSATVTAHAKDIFHTDNAPVLARRLRGVDAVVTVSDYNVRHLREVLGRIPVHHVPNGVGLGPDTGAARRGPVLCVARLVPKKGIDTLLRAIALLDGSTLEVIGDGPLAADLRALAAALGNADRVSFLGALPSSGVAEALGRCSVFALPCRVTGDGDRDGIPTALLEAMAHGVPVVSTAVVGIPEVVQHGRTGLLVPPDDPDALAGAIATIESDPAVAARLGAAGRRLVATRFDPDASAGALRAVFAAASRSPEVVR